MFPSVILLFANIINQILQKSHPIRFSLTGVMILPLVMALTFNLTFLKVDESKINPLLSTSLIREVDSRIRLYKIHSGDAIAFVNWGDYNRFLLTRKTSDEIIRDLWDVWPWFDNNDSAKTTEFLDWVTTDGPWSAYNKILFVQSSLSAPGLRSSLIETIQIEGWEIDKVNKFSGEGNDVIFILLKKST